MEMRKIKRILIFAIVTIIGVASFGCKPSNESAYPVYGDFVCNIVTKRDGNKFISIRELSDAGKNKNSIIVPNKIDGYEVRIGRTGIWSYGGYWESDKLKNVYVCKDVVVISYEFLKYTSALQVFDMGSRENDISTEKANGEEIIKYCTSLTQVVFPQYVYSIGDNAFYQADLSLTEYLPSSLANIGNNAFAYTALKCIYLPKNLANIGNNAFTGCTQLIEVYNFTNMRIIATIP